MDRVFRDLIQHLDQNVVGYLPDFLGGVALLLIGSVLGWVTKRVVIQISAILRLERLLIGFSWSEDLSKADVRYGFYNLIGNIAFFIVVLIFLIDALSVWKLTMLSGLLKEGISFLPKAIIALVVFGLGWLISSWTGRAMQRALRREEIPRAASIARLGKAILILFFSAMALTELDIAREIVIIGFATVFITLGVLAILVVAMGGKDLMKKIGGYKEDK